MIHYILDTDILSLLQGGHVGVRRKVASVDPEEIAVTVITVEEHLGGWYAALRRARKPRQLARVYQRIVDAVHAHCRVQVVTFSEAAMGRYESLKSQKLNVGHMDLRIAAIVLEHDACLVTRNVRDFQRITGLQIEDWTA
ncbi:MAG: type II toxin-antitoxin system VapC family toxin [Planctomycetaceae bacterium]